MVLILILQLNFNFISGDQSESSDFIRKFLTFEKISVPRTIKGASLFALVRLIFALKNVLVAKFEKRNFKIFSFIMFFFSNL